MRNKYSKKFEDEMRKKAPSKTILQLLKIANDKYNYSITKKMLMNYLSRREIRYKDYNPHKSRLMSLKVPIGTEYVKSDGMILVKTAPDKWKYKQRLIYENYYGVQLTSNDYIIFLDQDRTNFNISNLKRITRHESSVLANQKIFSKNPEITNLGIDVARLIIETKRKNKKNKK